MKRTIVALGLLVCVGSVFGQNGQRGESMNIPLELKASLGLSEEVFALLQNRYALYKTEIRALRKKGQTSDRALAKLRKQHLSQVKGEGLLSEDKIEGYQKFLSRRSGRVALKSKLTLTAEQARKFDAVDKAFRQMVGELRDEFEGDAKGMRSSMRVARDKKDELIASFLTKEQYSLYKKETQPRSHDH